MIRRALSELHLATKRRLPDPFKRWVLNHVYDPARIYDTPQGSFPTILRTRRNPDARNLDPRTTRVAFHHIMKTAGSSFRRTLETLYNREDIYDGDYGGGAQQRMDAEQFARFAFVAGHFRIDLLTGRMPDALWLTFLRDPVERVASHYYMDLREARRRTIEMDTAYRDAILSLPMDEFVAGDTPQINWIMDNYQTKSLCEQRVLLERGKPLCQGYDQAIVAHVKSNLANRFAFVGIQDEFGFSIRLFEMAFGLRPIKKRFSTNLNPSKPRGATHRLTKRTRSIIADRNRMDAEVYAYARQLMHEHADALAQADTRC